MRDTALEGIDWTRAAASLIGEGWVRLEAVVDASTCARLIAAAPGTWQPEAETIGDVRQSGLSCGVSFDEADRSVREVGRRDGTHPARDLSNHLLPGSEDKVTAALDEMADQLGPRTRRPSSRSSSRGTQSTCSNQRPSR